MIAPPFSGDASATFEGNLHEAAASSVSGLPYDAEGTSPSVTGAIIGARQGLTVSRMVNLGAGRLNQVLDVGCPYARSLNSKKPYRIWRSRKASL